MSIQPKSPSKPQNAAQAKPLWSAKEPRPALPVFQGAWLKYQVLTSGNCFLTVETLIKDAFVATVVLGTSTGVVYVVTRILKAFLFD